MRKKFIYFIAIVFTVLACSDEFSQVPAVGALSEESLANEQGVNLLLTGVYSILNGTRNGGSAQQFATGTDNWWIDTMSDDAHKGSTDSDQQTLADLELYNITTSNDYVRAKFQILYAGVNRANAVLALIAANPEEDFSVQAAEAYFLRGFFYFELTKIYGNVSIISIENYLAFEFNQPNNGPVWDQVESDLQAAIDNLPSDQGGTGRPTQNVARAFLGKAHLYQQEWSQALALFTTVINSGEFSLNDEYLDNFTAAGELSSESLFSVQHQADQANSPNGNIGSLLSQPGGGPYGSCCGFFQPTIDLANAFKTDGSGLPLLDTYNQSDIANDYGVNSDEAHTPETGPLDPRIDYTVGRRGIDFNGWGENIGKDWIRARFEDISGPFLAKKTSFQVDEAAAENGNGGWGQTHSGIDYNVMRYADVLLMGAEAAVETSDLATALDYVNQVRKRAMDMTYVQAIGGGGDAANYQIEEYGSFSDQDFARKAVRFERRVELGMEGHRMFDLRRWGETVQTLNDYIANENRTIDNIAGKAATYTSTFDLMPIPLGSIDLSGGVLMQNPGY